MVKHIQTIRRQFVDELIVFDHFTKLALKVLMRNIQHTWIEQLMKMYCQGSQRWWCRCLYWMEKMYNTRVSKRKVNSQKMIRERHVNWMQGNYWLNLWVLLIWLVVGEHFKRVSRQEILLVKQDKKIKS